ncbi:hypothetical protein TA3x_005668 [Tundrisphaera sp. TA3]|uniref:hypothetical protein n=1 Tax=Tundrisphaera sp. TA3 TaxID=3435775 RepID=UPI003EBE1B4B
MSVSIAQNVRAYAAAGIGRGHITVNVTVTNQGPETIFGSSQAVHFTVRNSQNQYLQLKRTNDPSIKDMTGPIGTDQSFETIVHFDTVAANVGEEYFITCIFDQTGNTDTASFTFRPIYLETPGQPPFNQ